MPRKERDLKIVLSEDDLQDAAHLWIRTYHGIEIEAKRIVLNEENGRVVATCQKKPNVASDENRQSSQTPAPAAETQNST